MMRHSQRPDYYELLGLERNATEADIKRAYRRLGRRYHPDVNPGDAEAEELFKKISEAYAVLSDPERRARYDRHGHGAPVDFGFDFSGGPFDFFDLFSAAFGADPFGFGRGRPREAQVGRSLLYELDITLDEVLTGVERQVTYTRPAACETCDGTGAAAGSSPRRCETCGGMGQVRMSRNTFIGAISTIQDCPACRGTGRTVGRPCEDCRGQGVTERSETVTVSVPPGVRTGNELVLRGFGEAPAGGGRAGDLHVRINVLEHERFVRRGDSLHADLPISIVQAALGDTVTVETLDGPAQAQIPAGIQHGEEIIIPGRGLPRLRSNQRDDIHLHARIVVPQDLTPRQRELLAAFAVEGGEDLTPEDKSLLERIKDVIKK